MRGKVTFLAIVVACFGVSAWARLGESPETLAQRYGTPLATQALGDFSRSIYRKEGYEITVFYQHGVSVMETFASRGLDQASARSVVSHIAQGQIGCPGPDDESKIRAASGIASRAEVFWTWKAGGVTYDAAFNPVECTMAIFNQPSIYAGIHQALIDAPMPGA